MVPGSFFLKKTGFCEKAALYCMRAVIQRNAYYPAGVSHTIPVGMWSGDEQEMKNTHEKEHMAVAKVVELIGSSPNSWEEATANAVEAAAQTIRNIKGVDVKRVTAKVVNNKIVEYRAVVKIAFIVERE
jgi:flavin-binding protein dodecin